MLEFLPKQVSKGVSEETKITCLYFSCFNDFEYLFISLKSLEKLKSNFIKNIYLYMDKKAPFSKEQIEKIKKEFTWEIFLRTTKYNSSSAGVKLIINELSAIRDIIKEINKNDYLAKLDSDVLFISEKIFKEVMRGNNGALGQRTDAGFMEGGSCFFSCPVITRIAQRKLYSAIKKVCKMPGCELWDCRINKCPEDRVFFRLLIENCNNIKLLDFRVPTTKKPYLFDKSNIIITRKSLEQYSIMHFSKWCNLQKNEMEKTWRWLQGREEELHLSTFFSEYQNWF